MAQRTIVQLVDDLDGKELTDGQGQTVTFSLDGVSYEIDLSNKNAQKMRQAFGEYVNVARKVGGSRTPRTRGKRTTLTPDASVLKAWADSKGFDYPKRGRLPKTLIERYHAEAGSND